MPSSIFSEAPSREVCKWLLLPFLANFFFFFNSRSYEELYFLYLRHSLLTLSLQAHIFGWRSNVAVGISHHVFSTMLKDIGLLSSPQWELEPAEFTSIRVGFVLLYARQVQRYTQHFCVFDPTNVGSEPWRIPHSNEYKHREYLLQMHCCNQPLTFPSPHISWHKTQNNISCNNFYYFLFEKAVCLAQKSLWGLKDINSCSRRASFLERHRCITWMG